MHSVRHQACLRGLGQTGGSSLVHSARYKAVMDLTSVVTGYMNPKRRSTLTGNDPINVALLESEQPKQQ